jgi:hypothetical protein
MGDVTQLMQTKARHGSVRSDEGEILARVVQEICVGAAERTHYPLRCIRLSAGRQLEMPLISVTLENVDSREGTTTAFASAFRTHPRILTLAQRMSPRAVVRPEETRKSGIHMDVGKILFTGYSRTSCPACRPARRRPTVVQGQRQSSWSKGAFRGKVEFVYRDWMFVCCCNYRVYLSLECPGHVRLI